MAVESLDNLTIGQTIRFKTISTHDNVYWTGKITGICSYDLARLHGDVDVYYQDVKRTNSDMAAKEELTYLVMKVAEDSNTIATRIFAKEWLDQSTVEIVKANTYTDFRVYDIDSSKATDVLTAIQALGYTVEIVES